MPGHDHLTAEAARLVIQASDPITVLGLEQPRQHREPLKVEVRGDGGPIDRRQPSRAAAHAAFSPKASLVIRACLRSTPQR
jgi:hypothetical protein